MWHFKALGWTVEERVSIHTPTKGVTRPTHDPQEQIISFNPHTHEGCDHYGCSVYVPPIGVSIHTPTKGVTTQSARHAIPMKFQSTHPRRVWRSAPTSQKTSTSCFNPHTHEGCDADYEFLFNLIMFQSTHPRRVWLHSTFFGQVLDKVSIHTPTKGVTMECRWF